MISIRPVFASLTFALTISIHLFGCCAEVSAQSHPFDIPSPRPDGWVTDMTDTLSVEAIEHISQVCEEVNQRIGREMTVVVIGTTNGKRHRQFATDLFNHWGIGDARKNNGILLFAAMQDRQAEIILGDDIDAAEKIRVAQQIMDNNVIPNFKAGDPNSAMYEGIRACATRIYAVADLDVPPELPSAKLDRAKLRRHRQSRKMLPWFLGLLGLGGIATVFGGRYWARYRPRYCEDCQGKSILLDEVEDDQFLDPAEQIEERIGSVDYDVWACLTCESVLKIRYGKLWTRYSRCPQCEYKTRSKITRTLVRPTEYSGGRVQVEERCAHCTYYDRHTYRTPRIVRSSSSSSGSGFGGGGGSFGGGGSGFGGGSSSGGGASGGW